MLNGPFSPWPSFTEQEAKAISDVLLSNNVNYWTGQQCRVFERQFAAWSNTKFAVALSNGTVALDVALKALNIGIGDEVVVTPRTFLASVSSVVTAGAIPVFADVDFNSQNISADTIAPVLRERTRAGIVVHLAGMPADRDSILALANEHGFAVIEDCAQAHGAKYKGRPVGSIGHVGAWSFCQDKIMTTAGEGGMVTTDDEVLWSKMWSYKDHGKSFEAIYGREHPPGFRWLHESFGTNGRMTEIQAAVGIIQLNRMAVWTAARQQNQARVWQAAAMFPALRVPVVSCSNCNGCSVDNGCQHAGYKCYIFVRPECLNGGWSRDRIIDEINARGVPCYSGSCSEVYLEKAFDDTPYRPKERLPVAKELGETSLMFLVHPTLNEAEIQKTCDVLIEVMKAASQ